MHVYAPNHDEALDLVSRAKRYNEWTLGRARKYLGASVMDFGAGIGTFTAMLAPSLLQVVAVEPEPSFAGALRRRFADAPNVAVLQADAAMLPTAVPHSSFDAVICFNVLEHISDDRGALEGLRTCLQPGGYLLLLVPAHPWLYGSIDRLHGHERRYRKNGLTELLSQSGLSVELVQYVNPVGALGWFVAARLLQRKHVSPAQLRVYEAVMPALRLIDHLRLPFGASLWAVARRPMLTEG